LYSSITQDLSSIGANAQVVAGDKSGREMLRSIGSVSELFPVRPEGVEEQRAGGAVRHYVYQTWALVAFSSPGSIGLFLFEG